MSPEAHPTPEKIQAVKELSDLFEKSKGLYFADFTGLNVEQVNKLRGNLREAEVIYRVAKNTLIRRACENAGYKNLIPFLEGPTAIAVSLNDPVVPVRLISDFHKGLGKPIPLIKAGILENVFISADDIKFIKDIPPREVLLSIILSALQSPVANFVMTLNEIVRSFVAVLQAVIDKKKAAGETE